MTLLLTQSGNYSQQTLGKLTACVTLSPKAPRAPEHGGTQSPLSGIVCQFYRLVVDKRPQGWLVPEQGTTQRCALGLYTRRPFPQEGPHLQPELRDIDAEGGALQGAIPHPVPPVEELPRTQPQRFADGPSRPPGLGHLLQVANQMGPAELTMFSRYPAIAGPTVGNHNASILLAQEFLGYLTTPAAADEEYGDGLRDGRP